MTTPAAAGTGQQDPPAGRPAAGGWRVVLESAGGLGVAAALLYSFGIAYARAYFGFFGVDVDVLGLTTEQVMALSLAAAFEAVGVLVIVVVAAVLAAAAAAFGLRRASDRVTARVLSALLLTSLVALAAGLTFLGLGRFDEVGPVLLGAGAGGFEWSLQRTHALPDAVRPRFAVALPGHRSVTVGVVAVAAFWFVLADAGERGAVSARSFSLSAQFSQHGVRLYSTEMLRIQGAGVVLRDLAESDEAEPDLRYRYEGLVLLSHAGDRWLLVPRGLQGDGGPVFVVPDRPGRLRVDFVER